MLETALNPSAILPQKSRPSVVLREAFPSDYDQIAALHTRNGLDIKPRNEWMALWEENPACRDYPDVWPIGWVLENSAGYIVGSIANLPCTYHFRGRLLQAAAAFAWVTDAQYRGYSMLLMQRLLKQDKVRVFVTTTVSSNAEPGLRAVRWSRVPVGQWHRSAFWITNYSGFSRSALRVQLRTLSNPLRHPASAWSFCRNVLRRAGTGVPRTAADVELCTTFDGRFDGFWEELKSQNPNILQATRSRDTLDWHFRSALAKGTAWVLSFSKGSSLQGYAIFDRRDNAAVGLKRARLVDYQALHGSDYVFNAALGWMLHKCREERIHMLEIAGAWLDRSPFPQPPHQRVLPYWSHYYKASGRELALELQDPLAWSPSWFDGDGSL